MTRNIGILLVLSALYSSTDAMQLTYMTQGAVATRDRVHVNEVHETAVRLLVPLPTNCNEAAKEVFSRILLCFIDGESESVRRAGFQFLTRLEKEILKCDGPLESVIFRAPQVEGAVKSFENTLGGYLNELAELNPYATEAVAMMSSIFKIQQQRSKVKDKKITYVCEQKLANGATKRWSIPTGCWVMSKGAQFFDPSSTVYQSHQFSQNIVDVIVSHIETDSSEEFEYFLSDLEAHVNAPFERIQNMNLGWVTHSNSREMEAIRRACFAKHDFNNREPQIRYSHIETILSRRYRTKGTYKLDFQKARLVPDDSDSGLFVTQQQVKQLEKQVQEESERPAVLSLTNAPDDVKALRAQLVAALPAARNDNPFMLALLQAGACEEALLLPAPAGAGGQNNNNAGSTGGSGPKIEEVD